MVFSNLTFVCLFLPITLALYFSSPRSFHNAVLVLASVVFYIWGGRIAIVLVLISIAANFHLGQAIAAAGPERRDRLIRWSVAGNLFILIVFKYLDFVVDNVNVVLDAYWHWKIPSPNVPLPIGISFFTFHIISYLVDVYRGVAPPQRSPVPFALYIINFPQLIAGPIVRYRPISAQLTERTTTFADFEAGLVRFAVGLSKKLLIANPIGGVADHLFALAPRICRSGAYGSRSSATRSRFISISRAIRTWRSEWRACSASAFRRISTIPIPPYRSRISGGAGT